MVKLSPMLDLSLALNELKTVRAVHIVAVNNECKELLLILQKESISSEISIHCETYCRQRESRHYLYLEAGKTSPCLLAGEVRTYLYGPECRYTESRCFSFLSTQTYPVMKTSPQQPFIYLWFLWFRIFRDVVQVEAVSGLKKGTESVLDGYGQGEYYDPQLSIIGCGTSQTFETERGRMIISFATTLSGGQKVLIRGKKC